MVAANFIGVKVGDVNGTYQSNAKGTAEADTRSSHTITTTDLEIVAGQSFTLPFSTVSDVTTYGLQMTIEFDADKVSFAGRTDRCAQHELRNRKQKRYSARCWIPTDAKCT